MKNLKNLLVAMLLLAVLSVFADMPSIPQSHNNYTKIAPIFVGNLDRFPVYDRESAERYAVPSVAKIRGSLYSSGFVSFPGENRWFDLPYVKGPGGSSISDMFGIVFSQNFEYQIINPTNDVVERYIGFANADGDSVYQSWYQFKHEFKHAEWVPPADYFQLKLWRDGTLWFNLPGVNSVRYRYTDENGYEQQNWAFPDERGRIGLPWDMFESGKLKDITFNTWEDGIGGIGYVFGSGGYSILLNPASIPAATSGELPFIRTVDLSGVSPGYGVAFGIFPTPEDINAGRWPQYQIITKAPVTIYVTGYAVIGGQPEFAKRLWMIPENAPAEMENEKVLVPHYYVTWQLPAAGTYWVRATSPNLP